MIEIDQEFPFAAWVVQRESSSNLKAVVFGTSDGDFRRPRGVAQG